MDCVDASVSMSAPPTTSTSTIEAPVLEETRAEVSSNDTVSLNMNHLYVIITRANTFNETRLQYV